MNRNFIIAIITLAASSLVFGQIKNPTAGKPDATEQTLIKIEQEMADALTKADSMALENILADTFVFSAPTGNKLNKTQVINDVKTGALKMESLIRAEMSVQIYDNVAVVAYSSTDKASFKNIDISGRYRWTDVFINRDGKWQLVSEQGTPIRR